MSEPKKFNTLIVTADPEYIGTVKEVVDKLTAIMGLFYEIKDLFEGSLKHSLKGDSTLPESLES